MFNVVRETSETKLQNSVCHRLFRSLERLTRHLLAQQPKKSSDIFFQILYLLLTDLLMSDHILDKNKYRILFHQYNRCFELLKCLRNKAYFFWVLFIVGVVLFSSEPHSFESIVNGSWMTVKFRSWFK